MYSTYVTYSIFHHYHKNNNNMMNSQNDFAFIILKLNTVIYSSIMKQFCKESLSSTHLISRVIPFEDDDPSKTNMGMSLFNR